VLHLGEQLILPGEEEGPPLDVAVAAEVLGRRVEDDVDPQGERPLEDRGGEGVVGDRERPRGAGAGRVGFDGDSSQTSRVSGRRRRSTAGRSAMSTKSEVIPHCGR
jgi:hypothetical protein